MNGYTGKERRKYNFETIVKAIKENGNKLDIINGTVKKHKINIRDIFGRLKTVEDAEIFEDGVREGKKGMKASTRNMIIVVLIALSCLFAGIKTFQSSQKVLIEKIVQITKAEVKNGG